MNFRYIAIGALVLGTSLVLARGIVYQATATAGVAKFKVKYKEDNRTVYEGQLESEGEKLPANADYTVRVDGTWDYPVTTNAFGRFSLRAVYNNAANHPNVVNGTQAQLIARDGTIVMTGTFAQR